MKISIITAVYNREKTLSRALKSIKEQIYKNIEIIVIDGKSVDRTIEIAKSFLTSEDTFISEKDDGIYDALNKGISAATGDIIGFLHSDDFYENNKVLSTIAEFFNKNNLDIVYGNASFFKKDNPAKIIRKYKSDKLSVKNLAWGKMPAHTSMFFRKDIFQEYGLFNTDYRICGDYEFLCRIIVSGDIKSHHIPKTFIKMQLGGVSTGGITNTIIINKETLKACRQNGIYTNMIMLFTKYPSKIMQYINKG